MSLFFFFDGFVSSSVWVLQMFKMLYASERFSLFLLLLSTNAFHSTPPGTHTPFQPPPSIQTAIQPHQTSVLMSEAHEGIYFYSSLEPLPLEHLTRFHTSSHLQSPTETQSSCLSSIIQNNLMADYLPPFICIQFHPR